MNAVVKTKIVELSENRVRLTVDVLSADIEHAVDHASSDLAERTKVPGFRKGKVPMPVLIKRIGSEKVYAEAVETHIGGWFRLAAGEKRLRPVSEPQFDFELPPSAD